MTDLIKFPDTVMIREEACLWISKMDAGLSEQEREDLELWLSADPAHRKALISMAGRWDELEVLSGVSELLPLERYIQGLNKIRFAGYAIAASFILAILVGWYSMYSFDSEKAVIVRVEPAPRSYETAIGERSTVQFSDGSLATLNTNSFIDVNYKESERSVTLKQGESFFEVAADLDRPFNVYAGSKIIQAVGTAFNVRLHSNDDVEVTVVEGKVKVIDARNLVMPGIEPARPDFYRPDELLLAGDKAIVEKNTSKIQQLPAQDIDIQLAWQKGMLVFEGESLESALAEVARYTTVKFEFEEDAVRRIKVGGYFRAGDIAGLLTALEKNFNISSRFEPGNRILLSSN